MPAAGMATRIRNRCAAGSTTDRVWVPRGGVEPPTFRFSVPVEGSGGVHRCRSTGPDLRVCGGQGRGRTADLPIFSRTLVPTELPGRTRDEDGRLNRPLLLGATPTGLEPATSAVTGRRANQLRYGALLKALLRIPNGIRTRATAVKGRGPGPLDDGDPTSTGPQGRAARSARIRRGLRKHRGRSARRQNGLRATCRGQSRRW